MSEPLEEKWGGDMRGVYNRFYNMALRRLSSNGLGSPIKITREGESSFDPTTGEVTTNKVEVNTSGIKMNVKEHLVDGELILATDVLFYVSPETDEGGSVPLILSADQVEFSGRGYVVVDVRPWDFEGIIIGQKVHARVMA